MVQYRFAGDMSRDYSLDSYNAALFFQSFARRGVDYRAIERTFVMKMPAETVFGIIKGILNDIKPIDGYTVREIISDNIIVFSLGIPVPATVTEYDDIDYWFADYDIIRVSFSGTGSGANDGGLDDWGDEVPGDSPKAYLTGTIKAMGVKKYVQPIIDKFYQAVTAFQKESKSSLVKWIYSSGNSYGQDVFLVEKTWSIKESFYPWIKCPLREYYQRFLDSNAQILVAHGPPGTGKTSWIRDFLCEMNLNAFISYDTKVLTSDQTFVNYLLDPLYNAIILEDSDDFLTAARGDNDKLISKILNISDGLIKLPKKKLIFSSNLPTIRDIDSAIIRPGRCFDVLEFRRLTGAEAAVAAKDINITLKENDKNGYSLAELFGMKILQEATDPLLTDHGSKFDRGIGFLSK